MMFLGDVLPSDTKFCPLIKEQCKKEKSALWGFNDCLIYIYLRYSIESEQEEYFEEAKYDIQKAIVRPFWDLKKLWDLYA
jgi:hypothetical protein